MKKAVLAFLIFCAFSCKKKVETITVTTENITESVYASGNIKSRNQYQVFASANGIINSIDVTEGDRITKGQRILTLKNDASQLSVENARIAAEYATTAANRDKLNELRINIDLAREKMQNDSILYMRQKSLWAQEIGSRYELEQRELAFRNSSTAYRSAILRYNDLQKQIDFSSRQSNKNLQISSSMASDYTVRAKQNGKVYKIYKEPGEAVNTQTPIAIIGDADDYILELDVDEFDIGKIALGQKVFVSMDSYKGQTFEAVVTKVDPIMDDRSRSFTIEATFTSRPPNLYPNLTAEANILINSKQNALTIPRTYLLDDEHVVLKNGDKRKVTVGLRDYQKVEITGGLNKGDEIQKPAQ